MAVEPRNEAALVRRIIAAVKQVYPQVWITKIHGGPYQRVGLPDLLICLEGHLVGLEVKHRKPGESDAHVITRVTPTQWNQIDKIRAAGGTAEVVASVAEVLAILADISPSDAQRTTGVIR